MEISSHLIQQAFRRVSKGVTHQELDATLEELANETPHEILFATKSESKVRSIDSKIRHIISSTRNRLKDENDVNFNDFITILATVQSYFERAIRLADINSLLAYLSANCYLQIDFQHFAQRANITKEETKKLSGQIHQLLATIGLQVNIPPNAPYSERSLFKRAQEGFKEQNIEKIYELILAVERSSKGFNISFLLETLIHCFLKIDKGEFLTHIEKLNHPQQNVLYFQSFPNDDIIDLLREKEITNKWVLFELIRQSIKREEGNGKVSLPTAHALTNAIRALYHSDYNIYRQSISFFHSSKSFNYALGHQLSDVDVQRIAEIFAQQFQVDQYSYYIEHRTLLLDQLRLNITEDKYRIILSTVSNKWNELYQFIQNSDTYLNDLLLTDFANFIVDWYKLSLTDEQLADAIDNYISRLLWIDSEWFQNISKQVTVFHLYLSQLYLLSNAFANKGFRNDKLSNLILGFEQNLIVMSRFLEKDSTIVDTIKKNLSGGNLHS